MIDSMTFDSWLVRLTGLYVRQRCQILVYGYAGAKNFGVTVYAGTHIFGRTMQVTSVYLNVLQI